MSQTDRNATYDNPLVARYAGRQMCELWSPRTKIITWRKLWITLAETEAELGLPITAEQLEQMRERIEQIDWDRAAEYEQRFRHDVMAHVHLFGELCPDARPIIHLGATSAFVTDNTDLLLLRDSFKMIRDAVVSVIDALAEFAARYRDLPCLGLTHLQPAQPTTVGKRATLWCYELVMDLGELEHRLSQLLFRGVKVTTGTQASFLALFKGDHAKVDELDRRVAAKLGFPKVYPVCGQTYSRKVDSYVLDTLSGIAQSAHKFGSDLRLLAARGELEEPFEAEQIGSSAMPYKRNPMRAERVCSLARFIIGLQNAAAHTAATQWLERTLDDSAVRRLVLPQAFLATDAVLRLYLNIARGLVVYPEVVRRNLEAELPFLATENILMAAVDAGGDRQSLHERIRQHSMEAARQIKQFGRENDLLDRLRADPAFAAVDFDSILEPSRFVGRAPQQVDDFIRQTVRPILARFEHLRGRTAQLDV